MPFSTSILTCEIFLSMSFAANRLGLRQGRYEVAIGQGLGFWALNSSWGRPAITTKTKRVKLPGSTDTPLPGVYKLLARKVPCGKSHLPKTVMPHFAGNQACTALERPNVCTVPSGRALTHAARSLEFTSEICRSMSLSEPGWKSGSQQVATTYPENRGGCCQPGFVNHPAGDTKFELGFQPSPGLWS